jgi:uncharacterized protein (DUF433 family)
MHIILKNKLIKLRAKAMSSENLLSRITIDPNICSGKPCIKGHRIWVSLILDLLAAGETIEELLQAYPSISREDILACIAYGAEIARDSYVEIPLSES